MDVGAWLTVVFGAAITALLFVLLLRQQKGPPAGADDTADRVNENLTLQLRELQRDLAGRDDAVNNTVRAAMQMTDGRLEALGTRTYESQLQTAGALAQVQEKLSAALTAQTAAVSAAVAALQASNERKLDQMRAAVDERLAGTLRERLDASFQTVSEQLGNVYKSLGEMQELAGGVAQLNRVFSGVKTRGTWAETQLESILDQIIPGMYVKNFSLPGSRETVEFAVKIPAADGSVTYLPVDSKFPMEDYLRLCDAADAGDAEATASAKKALEARVLAEGREISKYISPPHTTPFAVMYLATDPLYTEIVGGRSGVADRLHEQYRVLPAGPSTVTALLSSLAVGFRSVALNNKADEVMRLLAAAKTQYDAFAAALDRAKKKLDDAGRSLDEAKRRNDMIVKKLRTVETADGAAEGLFPAEEYPPTPHSDDP